MLDAAIRAVIFGAGNRGAAGPVGPPEPFYVEITPINLIDTVGFTISHACEVDWGDGNFVSGGTGDEQVPLGTNIVIKSDNDVTNVRFDYLSGDGWPAGANFKNINIVKSSTLTDADLMCAYLPLLETFSMADASNIITCRELNNLNYALTSFDIVNLDLGKTKDCWRAWNECESLPTFPALDISGSLNMDESWKGCFGLTTFPVIQFAYDGAPHYAPTNSGGVGFELTWQGCTGLTTFPAIDFDYMRWAQNAFDGCTGLTSWTGLNMGEPGAWYYFNDAGSINNGDIIEITTVGTTDYTNFGAPNNNIGTIFTMANAPGTGTGTVNQRDNHNFDDMFTGCSNLVCLSEVNTLHHSRIGTGLISGMFLGCTSLTAPSAGEQADITDTSGADYINPGACP